MITPPADWPCHAGIHVVSCAPPTGGASLRFHERLPPRRFRDLAAAALRGSPVTAAGPVERFVTLEGEHAAAQELVGPDGARRFLAAVLLDDFAALLDLRCEDPRLEAALRRLARRLIVESSFGLGVRRRRYRYVAPAGWLGVPGGAITSWYPPEFPRRRAVLVVHPAEPCAASATACVAELLEDELRRGFALEGVLDIEGLRTPGGLAGTRVGYRGRWPHDGQHVEQQVVVLADGRHRYVLRLEGPEVAADRPALLAVARSVEAVPVPAPRPAAAGVFDLAAPWSE